MEENTGVSPHSSCSASDGGIALSWLNAPPAVHRVPIESLRTAITPRLESENAEHADRLAALDAPLPPIVVHRPTRWVIDGVHRLRAAELRGQEFIDVMFFDGGADDAFVLAVELNRSHGLPLSTADRRAAAARIIGSHPEWSDRRISAVTGLAASTVGSIRARSTDGAEQSNIRIGRDGRARPRDVAERRVRASELMATNPEASLREIAKAAGISLATAWDVRGRLSRGEPPVSTRRRRTTESAPDVSRLDKPAETVDLLKRDPSLRFTDAGRTLLRLLACCTVDEHEWDQMIESLPSHQRSTVARLARECAVTWQEFADRLAAQADAAPPSGPRSA